MTEMNDNGSLSFIIIYRQARRFPAQNMAQTAVA
jgi:hypothetical protein